MITISTFFIVGAFWSSSLSDRTDNDMNTRTRKIFSIKYCELNPKRCVTLFAVVIRVWKIRAVPTAASLAAKISRNRTLRTPFLRLIFDDGSEDLEEEARRISFKM
jgi:hypothetical protein